MTVLLVALAALLGAQDSQGVYQPGQGVTVPRLLRDVKPDYTSDAMRANIEGYVEMEAPSAMAATVGQWWQMIARSFIPLAEAMPEEKWSFKPTGGAFSNVRTFAEQVKHVACSNEAFAREVQHKAPPEACETGGPNPAKTKGELLQYLRESFAAVNEFIQRMTPENALDAAGGRYGGQSTRLGLATLAVWHASDHYGQLVVYARMNNVIPPASR